MAEYIPWRTFSIFISSTFVDMQSERDYLKNFVFPKVEEELQKRQIKLEIVDLRWGVDTTSMKQEEERELNVLKVCLDEIRRCRPFFIGLLGDRYGWVPVEKRMKDSLIGEPHIQVEKGKSVTALEFEFGVLASKEQLVRSVFYFRNPLPYEKFPEGKAALFSDANNSKFSEEEREERIASLSKLKKNIVSHFEKKNLPDKVKSYTAIWNESNAKVEGLESWGEWVYNDILSECENHARVTWDQVPKNWQEQELSLLDAFIEQHTHISIAVTDGKSEKVPTFCGREEVLKELTKHLYSDDYDNWGKILTGESGSGKSAVFSMVYKMMQERKDCYILAHSAGLSPRAKSVTDLLKIWNRQLTKFAGLNEEVMDEIQTDDKHSYQMPGQPDIPKSSTVEKLQEKFRDLLVMVSAKNRVILLIDALDRFESTARAQHLSWLPAVMPGNVRVLCTTITGTEQKAVQYHKGLIPKSIDKFSKKEAEEMLDALCKRNHKTLAVQPRKVILEKERKDGELAISSPLWLSLAANMLMVLDQDDFEKISKLEGSGGEQIETYLTRIAKEFNPLPGPLFISLTQKAGEVFGSAYTKAVFDYIALSRNGLRERDLEKLLAENSWDSLRFANLRRWFKAHLILQGEDLQWNLAHSVLRDSLKESLTGEKCTSLHSEIATHLLTLVNIDSVRASETMFHLIESDNLEEAAKYYSSNMTEDEIAGSTATLYHTMISGKKGLEKVLQLPQILINNVNIFYNLFERYVFYLDDTISVAGNLELELFFLNRLYETVQQSSLRLSIRYGLGYNYGLFLNRLGIVNKSLGQTENAMGYFSDAVSIFIEFRNINPFDLLMLKGLATSYEALGAIHQSIGQMDEALKYFKEYHEVFLNLLIIDKESEINQQNLAVSYEKLGSIYQCVGQTQEALEYFSKGNRIFEGLIKANPESESLRYSLSISYSNLGKIQQELGNVNEALHYLEEDLELTNKLYEANPQNVLYKSNVASSYLDLGIYHQAVGHIEEAFKYLKKGSLLIKENVEANPENESLKIRLASSNYYLAVIYQSIGQMGESAKYYNEAIRIYESLLSANSLRMSLKSDLSMSYNGLGSILQATGKIGEALKYFEKSFILIKELYEANLKNVLLKYNYACTNESLGKIHQAMGNFDEALKYFEEGSRLLYELKESNPQDVSYKSGLAESFENLGYIHQLVGRTQKALSCFEKFNQLYKEFYQANPNIVWFKNGLAISYSHLGDIHLATGQIEEALNYFKERHVLGKELYESNPQNEAFKEGLAISYSKLGEIYQLKGYMEEALSFFKKSNQLYVELNESGTPNELLRNGLGISYSRIGDINLSLGRIEEALLNLEKRCSISEQLYAANRDNLKLLEGLVIAYFKLANVHKKVGNDIVGKQYFKNYKSIVTLLMASMPQVSRYREWDKWEYNMLP